MQCDAEIVIPIRLGADSSHTGVAPLQFEGIGWSLTAFASDGG